MSSSWEHVHVQTTRLKKINIIVGLICMLKKSPIRKSERQICPFLSRRPLRRIFPNEKLWTGSSYPQVLSEGSTVTIPTIGLRHIRSGSPSQGYANVTVIKSCKGRYSYCSLMTAPLLYGNVDLLDWVDRSHFHPHLGEFNHGNSSEAYLYFNTTNQFNLN